MKKTIVFGIDGADWDIINEWIERGKLPNLREVMNKGSFGDLKTTLPAHTASCWTSFATGSNPGKHGIFSFVKYQEGFDKISPIDSRDIDSKTFYELIEEEGLNPILVNLPLSHPPRVESPMVTSFFSKSKEFLYPKHLREEIDTGGFKVALDSYQRVKDVYEQSMKYIDSRKKVLDQLYNREWDFWFELFSPTDWVQHNYLSRFNEREVEEKLLDIYKEADKRIGKFLEENANVFIMSDHGFKVYKDLIYINEWLKRKGMLKLDESKKPEGWWAERDFWENLVYLIGSNRLSRKLSYFFLDKLWRFLPFPNIIKMRVEAFLTPQIDFKRSKAFCPHNALNSIYINDDRFYGVVKDRDKLVDEIIEGLREGIGGNFYKKEEIYSGENLKQAPDIIREGFDISKNVTGRLKRNTNISRHARVGIFAACGPDIKEGKKKNVSIEDIAPTVLNLMGIEQDFMDGGVLDDILS